MSKSLPNRVPCNCPLNSKVLETRKFQGVFYRLRECVSCGTCVVTGEVVTPTGRFPEGTQSGRKRPKVKIKTWADLGFKIERDIPREKK